MEEQNTVHLLFTVDKKYIEPLATLLTSYILYHRDVKTKIYVAYSSLDKEDFQILNTAVSGSQSEIVPIHLQNKYFKEIKILESIPEESFYRLLAFSFLPKEVEKCLYLDPDIYLNGSLLPLYNTSLENYYLAAAGHLHHFVNGFNKFRIGVFDEKRYFNSGVMLLNLKAIRQDFTVEKVISTLEKYKQWLIMGDQDLANILFGKKVLYLDERIYNLDERTLSYYEKKEGMTLDFVKNKTVIIHYNGRHKPWLQGYEGKLDVFYPEIEEKGEAPTHIHLKQFISVCKILRPTGRQTVILCSVLAFLTLFFSVYFLLGEKLFRFVEHPEEFDRWLSKFGVFDELLFILIRSLQTVVKFVPSEPLEILSGYAFGTVRGMFYCLLGNMIGTLIIFKLVKHFGEKIINILLPVKSIRSIPFLRDSKNIYALLFFIYLIPGSPKDGLTYFVALLPVKTVPFMLLTAIARIPSVISSTYCGNAFADKKYILSLLVLLLTGVIALTGGLIYRAYLKKHSKKQKKAKEL